MPRKIKGRATAYHKQLYQIKDTLSTIRIKTAIGEGKIGKNNTYNLNTRR